MRGGGGAAASRLMDGWYGGVCVSTILPAVAARGSSISLTGKLAAPAVAGSPAWLLRQLNVGAAS